MESKEFGRSGGGGGGEARTLPPPSTLDSPMLETQTWKPLVRAILAYWTIV